MKEVDWDIAPEGATHYNSACSFPWLKETPPSFFDCGDWVEYTSYDTYQEYHFDKAVKRPEWDGSGVPPVGTVCEYRLNEHDVWFKCEVVYVLSGSDYCFVARCEHLGLDQSLTFLSDRYKLQLRKIKTPEQIIEEKRQQAINEMIDFVDSYSTLRDVMGLLYDCGYRKTE